MANQEQVDRLLQGVGAWNQWKEENPEIKPDLSGARLSYADLSDANLSRANLSYADLSGARLSYADLSYADLSLANLSGADLSGADLSYANLNRANLGCANLSDADLSRANLSLANLSGALLSGALLGGVKDLGTILSQLKSSKSVNLVHTNLSGADLSGIDLSGIDFSSVNLSGVRLKGTDLSSAILQGANLTGADLSYAKLTSADFSNANLTNADLSFSEGIDVTFNRANLGNAGLVHANLRFSRFIEANLRGAGLEAAQALDADFCGADMTGACIEDWNINSSTDLEDVICDYVFTGARSSLIEEGETEYYNRIPHDPTKFFAPGDFAKLVQQSLDTVNLIFREGLDWRSFAYSFQQLQVQYADEQITIQTIENKGDGTVVVKLAVAPDADKGSIDQSFWRGFEMAQKTIAGQYEARLEDKDKHINQLFTLLQQSQEELGKVPKLMAENPRYDLRGAKFGGGFAADGGTQTGGTFNDFSQNIEQNINEIGGLIQALRSQAETFPEGVRQETLEHIADLETDIQQPPEKRKLSRIKAALLALAGMATVVSGAVSGANEFATNLQELSEKLGAPILIEQVQPQPPDAIDVKASNLNQP